MATRHIIAAVIGTALASTGCPGRLQNPERFATVDGSTMVTCTLGIDVPTAVFQMRCGNSLCHDAVDPEAKLDLVSPGVASRLVGVNSTQLGCSKALVDPTLPPAGHLLDKLTLAKPCFGLRMPYGLPRLTPEEVDCVRAWIHTTVSAGVPDGGGGDGDDDDGGIDAPADGPKEATADVPAEAAASPCQMKYGSVSAMICSETATSCEFIGKTMTSMSCRQLCAAHGGTCTDAFDNATGSCTRTGAGMQCDATMVADEICICTL